MLDARMSSLAAAFAAGFGVFAVTNTDVTELHSVISDTGHVFRAAAPAESVAFPGADVGTPIFWLDCSVTNGWEISADGIVTKACSRVGERYLTSTAVRPFNGNYNTPWGKMKPPRLVADNELLAGPALDFGAAAGATGLVFDAISVNDGTVSNVLYGIATVVAVYNARNGGGFLMGGGGYLTGKAGYQWHRGYDKWNRKSATDAYGDIFNRWWNPVFLDHGPTAFKSGFFWHDGVRTDPSIVGFSGGWEVVATEPRDDLGLVVYDSNGLGIGDSRSSQGHRSGGMCIAEMLVFGTQLNAEQLAKLDLYLDAKWLGRTRRGRNTRATIDRLNTTTRASTTYKEATPVTTVEVPAGQTMEIGALDGGRCSCVPLYAQTASLAKTGAGTLKIADAESYSGEIAVNEGRLAFDTLRPVPAELPFGAIARFDASDAASFDTATEDGEERVSAWRNLSGQNYRGNPFFLSAAGSARPVRRSETVFGETRTVVDFGRSANYNSGGKYLSFATNAANPVLFTPDDFISVVYVIRPRTIGRPNFFGGSFAHGEGDWDRSRLLVSSAKTFTYGYNAVNKTWNPIDGVVRVNGQEIGTDAGTGYDTLDYQVVTLRLPGTAASRYLGRIDSTCGGFVLAEAVFYNRLLNEREMADAEAYLAQKWLGRAPAGYVRSDAADRTPDVQAIRGGAGGEVYVAAGRTVRVGRISGTIVKTGEGTLEVQNTTRLGEDYVTVKGGQVTYALGEDPGDETMQVARGASLHLDASAADTFEYLQQNGTNFVRTWRSKAGGIAAYDYYTGTRPWVDTSAAKLVNGLPVVDFGPVGTGGRTLLLDRPLDGVRSVFMVWDATEGGGWVLGSCVNGNVNRNRSGDIYDFHRGIETGKTPGLDSQLIYATSPSRMVWMGSILTNGVPVSYMMVPARTNQLIEFHTLAGAHVSALACDRNISGRSGGQRLGEVIIYERELSEREKTATRNYLMKKWFNRDPEPLPAAPEVTGMGEAEYDVPYGETLEVTGGQVLRVTGGGTLAKTGEGMLTVANLGAFTGTVAVTDGALRLTGAAPKEGELVESGRILHFDASSAGLETTTNTSGITEFKAWRNLVDPAWTAEKGERDGDVAPDVMPRGLNGMPVIDMKGGVTNSAGQYMIFKKNGSASYVDNMHSVFWVIGSQNGGGYLMGGGTNVHNGTAYLWHRGFSQSVSENNPGQGPGSHDAPLIHSSHALKELKDTATWHLNGNPVGRPEYQPLSGEWDVLSMVLPDSAGNVLNAQGFAVDGRWLKSSLMANTRGYQRLAEVIVYNRALSDAERTANENYLLRKWGVRTRDSATNGATVDLAGGALDLGGETQYVGMLTGAGAVTNGNLTVGRMVADALATDWPVLAGEFVAPPVLELEYVNLATLGKLGGKHVKLLEAATASGLNETRIVGSGNPIPVSLTPRLMFDQGTLSVSFRRSALTIILK